ncbi:uncharacterized protein [Phyllobates terribilis]|uniref:uncharacterized protein n=1 Tax=Phyllobates terribilis TaxID=111132 RepID=UPI003CCAB167
MDAGIGNRDANSVVSISPGNTKYYLPISNDSPKPFVGQVFPTLVDGITFYKSYAKEAGFRARIMSGTSSKDGSQTPIWKYLCCTRQGYMKSPGTNSTSKKRKISSERIGCVAKIALRYIGSQGYCVKIFEERHTHCMVDISQRQFARDHRKLTPYHEDFILNCMKSNVGTSKAFKMFKNSVGSYANVGASLIDFKNFSRDLNAFMVGCDAQMLIDNLLRKKQRCAAFCFEYHVNDANELTRLFWADPVARKSFSFFGDVVSADATYRSNRYDMVFIPLTGVDNYKCSITFAFGLLLNEDIESYVWLFECFKNAMGHEPVIIMTDQDAAVKSAVESVFQSSVHRFCMWHIMFKVPSKIKVEPDQTQDFRDRFNAIVWSEDLSPTVFEDLWNGIILDFHLQDNSWFKTMFDLRHLWIPAYFQNVHMGALLRTTSRSESQNFFFSHFIGSTSSLVVFMLQFENAIDSQRHNHRKNDYESSTRRPLMRTPTELEVHCAKLFTIPVFDDVQKQILSSAYDCALVNITKDDDVHHYHVRALFGKVFVVDYLEATNDLKCSCNRFLQIGLPCCHMILVLRCVGNPLEVTLPDKYILPRWTKSSTLKPIFEIDALVFKEVVDLDEKRRLVHEVMSEMHSIINDIEDDSVHLKDLLASLKEKRKSYSTKTPSKTRDARFEKVLGPIPSSVDIHPPPHTKKKGRPRNSRLKSTVEIVRTDMNKIMKICSICSKPGHNRTTCHSRT